MIDDWLLSLSVENEWSDTGRDGSTRLDQSLRRERGQGNINFPCSAHHEQDWQPYLVDPYFAIRDTVAAHRCVI